MHSLFQSKAGGHLGVIPLTSQLLVVIAGGFIVFSLLTGTKVPLLWLGVFGITLLFSEFIHLVYGMNPIGMVLGAFLILSALFFVKTGFTGSPRTGMGAFFMEHMLSLVAGFTVLDVIRDLVDG